MTTENSSMTISDSSLAELTDEQLREVQRTLAARQQERERAKWDAELVGRYFRIIRTPHKQSPEATWGKFTQFQQDDFVTLEESLAVGGDNHYVYADVVYLHIQRRDGGELVCSGFEVSHANRREPYLKIQPVFYSSHDFRGYLNSYGPRSGGPAKHFDEISKDEYYGDFESVIANFTAQRHDMETAESRSGATSE